MVTIPDGSMAPENNQQAVAETGRRSPGATTPTDDRTAWRRVSHQPAASRPQLPGLPPAAQRVRSQRPWPRGGALSTPAVVAVRNVVEALFERSNLGPRGQGRQRCWRTHCAGPPRHPTGWHRGGLARIPVRAVPALPPPARAIADRVPSRRPAGERSRVGEPCLRSVRMPSQANVSAGRSYIATSCVALQLVGAGDACAVHRRRPRRAVPPAVLVSPRRVGSPGGRYHCRCAGGRHGGRC